MTEMLYRNEVFEQLKQFFEGYGISKKFEVINDWESSYVIQIPRTVERNVHKEQSSFKDPIIEHEEKLQRILRGIQHDKDVRQGAFRGR